MVEVMQAKIEREYIYIMRGALVDGYPSFIHILIIRE